MNKEVRYLKEEVVRRIEEIRVSVPTLENQGKEKAYKEVLSIINTMPKNL